MNLIPGEAILTGSVETGLVITTHRVRVDAKGWGQAHVFSIMLDELCSTELRYSSQPLLFPLAFFLFILGGIATLLIGSQASNQGTILRFLPMCSGVVFAIGAVLLYFITRRMSLVFASAGSSIAVDALSIGVDRAKDFMDALESAKNTRYFQNNMLPPEYQPVDYTYNP